MSVAVNGSTLVGGAGPVRQSSQPSPSGTTDLAARAAAILQRSDAECSRLPPRASTRLVGDESAAGSTAGDDVVGAAGHREWAWSASCARSGHSPVPWHWGVRNPRRRRLRVRLEVDRAVRSVTLWDWLEVLALPVAIATAPLLLHHRRGLTRRHRVAIATGLTVFAALALAGYVVPLQWTGFPGNTLWTGCSWSCCRSLWRSRPRCGVAPGGRADGTPSLPRRASVCSAFWSSPGTSCRSRGRVHRQHHVGLGKAAHHARRGPVGFGAAARRTCSERLQRDQDAEWERSEAAAVPVGLHIVSSSAETGSQTLAVDHAGIASLRSSVSRCLECVGGVVR